mgnify:FL=1
MIKKRRKMENTLFSFLDIISCGFGAIVMLILIYKFSPNDKNEGKNNNIFELILKDETLNQVILNLEKEKKSLNNQLSSFKNQITKKSENNKKRKIELDSISKKNKTLNDSIDALKIVNQSIEVFRTSNKKNLIRDENIGGIPVNSNYIIFVVDTSGSMLEIWNKVIFQIEGILKIHPDVKGFQILNDMGSPLISSYENKWIPDTTSWRKRAIKLFKLWNVASNSSPVEGILKSLNNYVSDDKAVSIYVIGDDYTGSSFDNVIKRITMLNSKKKIKAKIHGIGFLARNTTNRFSILMREMTLQNFGTFIALAK